MKTRLAILFGSVSLFIATSAVVAQGPLDPRTSQCGSEIPGNTVAAEFTIPEASHIWDNLPLLGITPELARDDRPAYVVLFDGDYHTLMVGVPGLEPPSLQNVVCVITADGEINIYSNVSRVGFRAP
jgi:hypothetical protein